MTAYRRNRAELDCNRFNDRFKVGETVLFTASHGGMSVRDRIFARAEALNGHSAVVWLAGQCDAVSIHLISKTPEAADAI
ncbi:MAG: hypothetical protein JWL63_3246 [Rhodocyclales bacterium]|nr:hypothetical protein [Rhodocyclales bacterium]